MSEDSSKTKSSEDKKAELLKSIVTFKKTQTRQLNGHGPNVLIHITQEVINAAVRAGLTDLMIKDIFPSSFDGNKKNQMIKAVPQDLINKRREWRSDALYTIVASPEPAEKDVPRNTNSNSSHKSSSLQNILSRISFGLDSLKSKDNQFKSKPSGSAKKVFGWGVPTLLICSTFYFFVWPSLIAWIDEDPLLQSVENNEPMPKKPLPKKLGSKPEPAARVTAKKPFSVTSSVVTSATSAVVTATPSSSVTSSAQRLQEFAKNIAEAKKREEAEKRKNHIFAPPKVEPKASPVAPKMVAPPKPKTESKKPEEVGVSKKGKGVGVKSEQLSSKVKVKPKQKVAKKKEFKPHITKRVY
jgi:hypothetical protein